MRKLKNSIRVHEDLRHFWKMSNTTWDNKLSERVGAKRMFRTRGITGCLYNDKNYLVVIRKWIKHVKEAGLFRNIIHEYWRGEFNTQGGH